MPLMGIVPSSWPASAPGPVLWVVADHVSGAGSPPPVPLLPLRERPLLRCGCVSCGAEDRSPAGRLEPASASLSAVLRLIPGGPHLQQKLSHPNLMLGKSRTGRAPHCRPQCHRLSPRLPLVLHLSLKKGSVGRHLSRAEARYCRRGLYQTGISALFGTQGPLRRWPLEPLELRRIWRQWLEVPTDQPCWRPLAQDVAEEWAAVQMGTEKVAGGS